MIGIQNHVLLKCTHVPGAWMVGVVMEIATICEWPIYQSVKGKHNFTGNSITYPV